MAMPFAPRQSYPRYQYPNNAPRFTQSMPRPNYMQCYSCNRYGHIARNCRFANPQYSNAQHAQAMFAAYKNFNPNGSLQQSALSFHNPQSIANSGNSVPYAMPINYGGIYLRQ